MLYVCFSSCLHIVPVTPFFSWNQMACTHLVENVLQHLAVPQRFATLYNYAAFHFPPELGGFPSFMVFYILRTNLLSSKLEPPRQAKYGCPCCQRWDKGAHCWIHMVCFLCFADSAVQRLPVHTSSVSFHAGTFKLRHKTRRFGFVGYANSEFCSVSS